MDGINAALLAGEFVARNGVMRVVVGVVVEGFVVAESDFVELHRAAHVGRELEDGPSFHPGRIGGETAVGHRR